VNVSHIKPWLALVALALVSFTGPSDRQRASDTAAASEYEFSHESVIEEARRLAAREYAPRELPENSPLMQLSYDEYREIRFNSERGIWRNEQVPFRLELLTAGFIYRTPVTVAVVESGRAHNLLGTPDLFTFGPKVQRFAGETMPLSGFRVRTRLNSRSTWDEFLSFQGASYFRAVARDTVYGLSARGLALRTAHPTGEEFPAFTHFWIERPAANATGIVIHALLDSPSATGAYRFSVIPGTETVMDVDVTLFPRRPLDAVGIAPLTSMFLFNGSDRSRIDDFRNAVHDSDGLQILSAAGEQIWRPLANPTQLQISSFTSTAPRGFGLVQRARKLSDYQDLSSQWHRRPSVWVEPKGEWGAGAVELIEIPTDFEGNDNIVAMWRPRNAIPAGSPWRTSYRLRWSRHPPTISSLAKVVATRSGPTRDGRRRMFVVDFDAAASAPERLRLEIGSSAGKLSNQSLTYNPLTRGVRATFELDPANATLAELRLRLLRGDEPVSETWLYRWTAS